MSKGRINDLIKTAQNAVESEIDIQAIYEWKKQAIEYLTDHLGPDHYYTQYFTNYMKEIDQKTLLTGGGVLSAVREEVVVKERQSVRRVLDNLRNHNRQESSISMST